MWRVIKFVFLNLYHFFKWIFYLFKEKPRLKIQRSSQWRTIRKKHLEKEPNCMVCNGDELISVHHIQSFHEFPGKELDPNNLITLCEGSHHINCHLIFGHLGKWESINKNCREDVRIWREKIKNRP